MLKKWTGTKLWLRILIGLILGVAVGVAFGEQATALKPIGSIFINTIKMLIVPLIFVSLVCGVTSMKDPARMGRIGIKTFVIFLCTTAFAILIGLGMGTLFEPGVGVSIEGAGTVAAKEAPSLMNIIVNLVPKNPVSALATGNVLQIIVFAILLGIAINMAGDKAKPVEAIFNSLSDIMIKLTHIVMEFAPIGVFALMAWVAGKYGLDVLLPMGQVIVAVYVACIVHAVLVMGGAVRFIAGLSPVKFFKGIFDAQAVAFTSTSSSATLPVTIQCARENLGASKNVSSFVLPLGATINMDGTAIYQGVAVLFIAQAFGVDLGMAEYATIIVTATLASIGTAGVPGAGLIMLSLVLTSVGLPLEGVALIAGIDRILDMARTCLNVTGDSMVNLIVAKTEGELDEDIFNAESDPVEESLKA
ncbi:dicarboxylate/amino acid:cation symporter [Terasakiella sp. A23]|uniref:dicarboxylate/amino acid:cation symporter n=1 Tax=Terasakiella sp. FCG-A23 TaxID=3080561 RepID=UPI002955952D|nr:dicarboxylate/amino acid:cation symporter [Terasakiella sp. A23]MDV7341221.1 dicarboxylate/amino acid:cation symporter [Terasakiella sp. A23]